VSAALEKVRRGLTYDWTTATTPTGPGAASTSAGTATTTGAPTTLLRKC